MPLLLDSIELAFGVPGEDLSLVAGTVLSGCDMVRMRVAAMEGLVEVEEAAEVEVEEVVEVEVEEVVTEDMDAGDMEYWVPNVRELEGTEEPKEANSCSGDGASKVSSVESKQ